MALFIAPVGCTPQLYDQIKTETIKINNNNNTMYPTVVPHGMYPLNYCMMSPKSDDNQESADVLDLCVRNRPQNKTTPHSPRNATPPNTLLPDPPTSTVCYPSPGSYVSEASTDSLDRQYQTSYSSDSPKDENQNSEDKQTKSKMPRPFKAYPKDLLTYGIPSAKVFAADEEIRKYANFRSNMLAHVQNQSKGTNARMRRNTASQNPGTNPDPTYWEKRRKNNEAAKRSRDARRAKEDEIAIRCAFLEQENYRLGYELASALDEAKRLRKLVYNES